MQDKLTMIISSCDKFSDIWEAQVELLNTNWPDRNINTVLVTDKSTDIIFKDVDIFPVGSNVEFSERLKAALSEVSTEYVLIILDDYFITEKLCSDKIQRLINVMDKEKLDYIRMYSRPKTEMGKLKEYKDLYTIDTNKNYSVNLYPGLWRVSFLMETFIKPLNAWEYEISLSKIAKELNANCVVSKGGEFPFLNGIVKGKFFGQAYRFLKGSNLYIGDRPVMSIFDTIKYNVKLYSSLLLPDKVKRNIKNVLRRHGYTFYSD